MWPLSCRFPPSKPSNYFSLPPYMSHATHIFSSSSIQSPYSQLHILQQHGCLERHFIGIYGQTKQLFPFQWLLLVSYSDKYVSFSKNYNILQQYHGISNKLKLNHSTAFNTTKRPATTISMHHETKHAHLPNTIFNTQV
jgi:hypothetical protein